MRFQENEIVLNSTESSRKALKIKNGSGEGGNRVLAELVLDSDLAAVKVQFAKAHFT